MREAPIEQQKKNEKLTKIVQDNAFKEKVPLGPKVVNKYLTKFLNK
jgi:hypothetical protein